ncbi:hypothetical protein [Arsenophonus endosymbiont of Aleurodicus floccissimus]|uniref:hypothetical protein n=1 Tax=Arsenophonus endosymbiont of Aleurodicus floccissimus TaxID=2152761 RepID=UPI000E6B2040|nr:hypothetical protein [Arsenophonus endosymbiont of Aleurodicus floccissimus]
MPVEPNASIVKKTALHGLQLIMNVSLYFSVTFVWLTLAFALSGNLSISYPFEPEAIYLTIDKAIDLFTPVFRLSLAITLMLCMLRLALGIFQKKPNKKTSTSC